MSIKDDLRRVHIAKRWFDIIALAVVVFLLYLASEPLISKLSNWVTQFAQNNGIIVNILVILLSLALIWVLLWLLGATHFGWRDKLRWKAFLLWPSIWLSAILSLWALFVFQGYTFVQITIISSIFLLGGFIISETNRWLTEEKKNDSQQSQPTESFHEISIKPEKVIKWLDKEEAITEWTQDIFDMAVQARNISRLLLKTPLKTAALVGEYGSGKSSILKMVDYYLKPENRNLLNLNNGENQSYAVGQRGAVITCTVDGWGFAKGSTAEHILERAINELGKHVDVSGLRTVPEQYAAAMGSVDNVFLKILAALATCWKSPLDILKRMDRVLIAIDKRFIIFLEDVDRNKNEETFFNEIAALLDTLRQLKKVSFVLAIGQEYRAEEVLIKTAEHVENVPRLNRFDVLKTLESFRTYCIALCPDITSKIPKEFKKDRIGWDRSEMIHAVAGMYDDSSKPIDAIVELTSNPRVLKHALRRTLTGWEKLAGEIDFDDLLIVNVLKVVDERIFSFIDKHIARLCALAADNKKEEQDELRKKLESEYKSATENYKYDIIAVQELMDALFPRFIDGSTTDELLRRDLTSYQHVANNTPTRYWERIKRGELHDNEIPDCEILEALRQWNEDFESRELNKMEMVEALSKDYRVFPKARQFKKLIRDDCLQNVASKQFGITLKEYGNKASSEVCPSINQWFTLGPERLDNQWELWLFDEIEKALPRSLRYATELYDIWYDPKRNPDGELRTKVVEAAKTIYENDPALLAKSLGLDYIWSVFEFTENFMETDKGTSSFHSEQWSWLGRVLLEVGIQNPKVIGVNIAAMFCYYPAYNREKGIEFNKKFHISIAEQIFDGNKEDVMRLLLLEGVDIEKYDEQSKAVLYCAQDEANKWLKQNNSQHIDNHDL
jgi:predicted AAA+ superfamily ATPase